jgi:predicted nucleic acid-binding protein
MVAAVCFDASTLINFAEAKAIVLLARHFAGRALIAGYVEDNELAATAARGIPIVSHAGTRWLQRVELSGAAELRRASDLQLALGTRQRHRGEAESIVVCEDRKAIFATDDSDAAQIAGTRSVRAASTIDILRGLIGKQHLSLDQAIGLAGRMRDAGQNVDPDRLP